jgi:hypothetical protein
MVLAQIAAWSFWAFGALLFLAQLVGYQLGYWLGRRRAEQREAPGEGIGALVGAVLGLLAFVLALTLAFASDRFNERRAGTLNEANAIGTAWLRAKAISQPQGEQIAELLEQYIEQRIIFVRANHDSAAISDASRQTDLLQSEIWKHLSALVQEQSNPVTASLMASLNEVFDMTTAERFAFALRLPEQIFWLLIGLTLVGMSMLGYELGLRASPLRVPTATLALTWTVVIVVILDLAAARIGSFGTPVTAYQWTLDGFRGAPAGPRPPDR